jgi:serine/threonine protein kinase
MLPTSHILAEGIETIGNKPYNSGGFADVWRGRFKGRDVAIKVLKIYATSSEDLVKVNKVGYTSALESDIVSVFQKFYKEVLVWKRLSHPNVLPFLGVSTSLFPFCMVSHWMAHGNIVKYVKANPGANRLVLVIILSY